MLYGKKGGLELFLHKTLTYPSVDVRTQNEIGCIDPNMSITSLWVKK